MNDLLTLLKNFTPADESERMSRELTVQFVEENAKAFERSLLFGHVTASALLLNKDKTKFLLMHHRKINKWFQVGGHCDGNPDTLEVAMKEATEESGIDRVEPVMSEVFDVDVHLIPQNKGVPAHFHFDIRFLLKTVDTDELVINHESQALTWFSFNDELPALEPSVHRMIRKAKELLAR
ncbi:MAG: hypothetical protein QG604_929 [Candidatus Dependentiae bacterium]|nr:hypothetical protein [Candidatus Dependentiae bacterium]